MNKQLISDRLVIETKPTYYDHLYIVKAMSANLPSYTECARDAKGLREVVIRLLVGRIGFVARIDHWRRIDGGEWRHRGRGRVTSLTQLETYYG